MRGVSATFVLCVFAIANAANTREPSETWRHRQVVWWNEDTLIKNAIVSGARLMAERRPLQSDSAFVDHQWHVVSLLLLFDSRQTDASRKTLASLSSYYLGESGGEIYRCLLLRKGASIRNDLAAVLRVTPTECSRELGKSAACLSAEAVKRSVEDVLRDIEKNTPCTIEQ